MEGILRLDDLVLVSQGLYAGDVILRRYALADCWVKINVTTDISGRFTETPPRLARVLLQLRHRHAGAAPRRRHLRGGSFR